MPSLVLEGGAFRGVFTQGALDALLEHEIMFPYVIGVSAGIANGYSYLSCQKGRNWQIAEKYYNDKRYYGYSNLKREKSMFGLKFIFETVPNELLPFDYEALGKYDGTALVGVTHAVTGKPCYFLKDDQEKRNLLLQASCSIPVVFPPVEINGELYFDGGLADPIPVKKAIADGNKKHFIILTQPAGYRKGISRTNLTVGKKLKKQFPGTAEVMKNRHILYNDTLDFCKELEKQGDAVIICPKRATVVDRFERDTSKLRLLYEDGYTMVNANIEKIKALFE